MLCMNSTHSSLLISSVVIVTSHHAALLPFAARILRLEAGALVFDGDFARYAAQWPVAAEESDETRIESSAKQEAPVSSHQPVKPAKARVDDDASASDGTFGFYLAACSLPSVCLFGALSLFAFGAAVAADYLTARWTSGALGTAAFFSLFATCTLGAAVLNGIRLALFARAGLRASAHVHARLLEATVGAKFEAHDRTPSGHFLSRFAADMVRSSLNETSDLSCRL